MKPPLTIERLKEGGFAEVGFWQIDDGGALMILDLPAKAGVYAFVIDGVAQYVGIASKSLFQRLRFYARPGATQRTSQRLNRQIVELCGSGARIEVLIAFPSDSEWGGFVVKGAEGLEAGIIATFDLPWNIRGAGTIRPAPPSARRQGMKGAANRIIEVIRKRPGMTELEIAKVIYGPGAVQQQVNQRCRSLLKQGRVERSGTGGQTDPFTYRARD
jgi:hypothetical protein